MTDRSSIDKIETVRNMLAFLLVSSFVSAVVVFTFVIIPEGNRDIITYMVGQLSGMAATALGFYFINKVGQDALDAKRTENTGKMAEAVNNALKAGGTEPDVTLQPGETAQAATGDKDAP